LKEITFRPLRRIKKTGKISVASYMQWYKVRCADYGKFSLKIDEEYKMLPSDEYVYNHKGERLFWRDYNPSDIPIFNHSVVKLHNDFDNWDDTLSVFENLSAANKETGWGYLWHIGGSINYHCKGLDINGTPTFSHGTEKQIVSGYKLESISQFEPLTVRMVTKWFGWFLYQLENVQLQNK
jgi:hypothetical protein